MGEIDEAVLEDGTVIHWPPHLGDRMSGVAARGDRVRASGWMETGPEGDNHFEVQSATNLRTNATVGTDTGAPLPPVRIETEPDHASDFAASPDQTKDVARRLKALEDQIAQLREEIRLLRTQR
jgi:hypothetical protein